MSSGWGKEFKCHIQSQVIEKNRVHQVSSYPKWSLEIQEKNMFQVQEVDEQYSRGILIKG